MKQVFDGINSLETHVISHLLEQEGIATNTMGDHLSGARGELPAMDLTSVWVVDDSDYERARNLIAAWDKQSPAPIDNGIIKDHSSKTTIMASLFGVIIGIIISFIYFYVPVNSDDYDYNNDGVSDTSYYYSAYGLPTKSTIDINFDNIIDREDLFDGRGIITQSTVDQNFDGRFETKILYKNGNFSKKTVDGGNDNNPNLVYFYDPNGNLRTLHYYNTKTKRIIKLSKFKNGKVISSEFDSDNDGTMDTQYLYDTYEEIASQKTLLDHGKD